MVQDPKSLEVSQGDFLQIPLNGGIDVSMLPYLLKEQSPNILNMWAFRTDSLEKFPGFVALGGTFSSPVVHTDVFELYDGTKIPIVMTQEGIYEYDPSTGDWTEVAGDTDIAPSYEYPVSGVKVVDSSGEDLYIWSDARGKIQKWTGDGERADLANMTTYRAKVLGYLDSCLVLINVGAGGALGPPRVRWTEKGDVESPSGAGAGFVDLIGEPSEGLAFIAKSGTQGLIYKKKSIYRMIATGNVEELFIFRTASPDKGTAAGASVVNFGSFDLLLDTDGVFRFHNSSEVMERVSGPIEPLLANINEDYIERSVGFRYPNSAFYFLSVPLGGAKVPNATFIFDTIKNSWFYINVGASAFGYLALSTGKVWDAHEGTIIDDMSGTFNSFGEPGGAPSLVFFEPLGLKALKMVEGEHNNDGEAFQAIVDTKDFLIPGYTVQNTELFFEARGTSVDLSISFDEGATWTIVKSGIILDDEWKQYRDFHDAWGKRIRYRFENSSPGGWFDINWYHPTGMKIKAPAAPDVLAARIIVGASGDVDEVIFHSGDRAKLLYNSVAKTFEFWAEDAVVAEI